MTRQQKYRRTKLGLATTLWHHLIRNSKHRNHDNPDFTKYELLLWMETQTCFNKLFTDWQNSGYEKTLTPSIDRKNNSLNYSFENIQLVTWRENLDNAIIDTRNKVIHNSGLIHQHSACVKYSSDGIELGIFISLTEAAKSINSKANAISSCCLGQRISHKGFFFCYLEDKEEFEKTLPFKIKHLEKTKFTLGMPVIVQSLEDNQLIEFKSLAEVSKFTSLSYKTILKYINNEPTRFIKKYIITLKENNETNSPTGTSNLNN